MKSLYYETEGKFYGSFTLKRRTRSGVRSLRSQCKFGTSSVQRSTIFTGTYSTRNNTDSQDLGLRLDVVLVFLSHFFQKSHFLFSKRYNVSLSYKYPILPYDKPLNGLQLYPLSRSDKNETKHLHFVNNRKLPILADPSRLGFDVPTPEVVLRLFRLCTDVYFGVQNIPSQEYTFVLGWSVSDRPSHSPRIKGGGGGGS